MELERIASLSSENLPVMSDQASAYRVETEKPVETKTYAGVTDVTEKYFDKGTSIKYWM